MDKEAVIKFFDERAEGWDAFSHKNQQVVDQLLDNAGIKEGVTVLDVGCGTGVLVPDYLKRGVASVLGLDISVQMLEEAKTKFHQKNVSFCLGDAENFRCEEKFDRIVVYNAFPHFPHPEKLVANLFSLLKVDGLLTICHGASRSWINGCHERRASEISLGLPEIQELVDLLSPYLKVELTVDDQFMYQIVGRKVLR